MNSPKVSVIMSVYNGEKYLKQAMDSIVNQTFKDFEFIIIDDGSTDTTASKLSSYKDSRICIVTHKINSGLTLSLNEGLKKANGTYIARMDADDISNVKRLEKEVAFLDSHKSTGLIGTWYEAIDYTGNLLFQSQPEMDSAQLKKNLQSKGNVFAHGSIMLRKECLVKTGLYNPQFTYAQDLDLWLRIAKHFEITMIPEFLYSWRIDYQSNSLGKLITQKQFARLAIKRAAVLETPASIDEISTTPISASLSYCMWGKNFISYNADDQALYLFKKAITVNPLNFRAWLFSVLTLWLLLVPQSVTVIFKNIYRKYLLSHN